MQVTVEIPDRIALQLEKAKASLSEVIERGLGQRISTESALAQEIIEFLGRGPEAHEIIAFRPSGNSIQRTTELLERNRESTLSSEEQTELEEIAAWNRVFALIKVQARLHLQATP